MGGGQQGFADVIAGELFAFEQGYVEAVSGEQGCGGTAAGAAADDCYVGVFGYLRVSGFCAK